MKKYRAKRHVNKKIQEGYLLLVVIIISGVLMGLAVAIMSVISTRYAKASKDMNATSAVYAAEAGVSDTMSRLVSYSGFGGYSSPKVFYDSPEQGRATYQTTVAENVANKTITITSIGSSYNISTSTTADATRTIKVLLSKSREAITDTVIAGPAGMYFASPESFYSNPTTSKGSVYSKGKIYLNGTNSNLGSTTASTFVRAANIGCGSGVNYPQACGVGSQPIQSNISGGGSGNGLIYGTVCATNQTTSSFILPGPTGSGLQAGCVAPDYGMPEFDKAAFTATKTTVVGNPCAGGLFGANVTLNNNVRINGNVAMTGPTIGTCNVTVAGDVYITGNLTINGSVNLVPAASISGKKPTIVVNGKITFGAGSGSVGVQKNANGVGINMISFASANSACSNSDTCNSIAPEDLYSSISTSSWSSGGSSQAIVFISQSFVVCANAVPSFSGLTAYAYFGTADYRAPCIRDMEGLGGQQVFIKPGNGAIISYGEKVDFTGTSPFSDFLFKVKYSVLDYQQVY